MMVRKTIAVFITILTVPLTLHAAEGNSSKCIELFTSLINIHLENEIDLKPENFIPQDRLTYRQEPQNRVISDAYIHDLANLRLMLDLAKTENQDTLTIFALESGYRQKEKEASESLGREELMRRLKSEISKLQIAKADQERKLVENKKNQDRTVKSVVIDGERIILNPISPGTFKMYDKDGTSRNAIIKKPFEMMATETTQIIWTKIAKLGKEKLGLEVAAETQNTKGDLLPMTNVSLKNVKQWLKILNHLVLKNEPELYSIIPDHELGSHYRLPSEEEWEFVLRNRGTLEPEFYLKDGFDLKNSAWVQENSDLIIHGVAEKLPLIVEGNKFFDLLGNAEEWMASADGRAYARGGAYNFSTVDNFAGHSVFWSDTNFFNYIGFRIVREMRKQ